MAILLPVVIVAITDWTSCEICDNKVVRNSARTVPVILMTQKVRYLKHAYKIRKIIKHFY